MPLLSNHHRPVLTPELAHYILFGFSAYLTICSLKIIEVMSTNKSGRRNWTEDEVRRVLRLLIEEKARIGQTSNFPHTVFNEISRKLPEINRSPTSISAKWGTLKKTWSAIKPYNKRSGCYFSPEAGLDLRTREELDAFQSFAKSYPDDAKELQPYMNKPFPYYLEMEELLPNGTGGADGTFAIGYPLQAANAVLLPPAPPPAPLLPSSSSSGHDLNQLAELGRGFSSPDPNVQFETVRTALSTLTSMSPHTGTHPSNSESLSSQTGSHSHLFSASAVPQPSSHTSYGNSHLPSAYSSQGKGKRKASTPAISNLASSVSSSLVPSKRSKVSRAGSEMGQTVAINQVSAVITNAFSDLRSWLGPPPSQISQTTVLPSSDSEKLTPPTKEELKRVLAILMADTAIPSAIRGELAAAFYCDGRLCDTYYAFVDDSELRKTFAFSWYQKNFPQKAHALAASLARLNDHPAIPTPSAHDTTGSNYYVPPVPPVPGPDVSSFQVTGPGNQAGPSNVLSSSAFKPPFFSLDYTNTGTGIFADTEGPGEAALGELDMDFNGPLFNDLF